MKLRLVLTAVVLLAFSPIDSHAQQSARWSEQKANDWYAQQPWMVGANFIPSSDINELAMFQAATFDPAINDHELGLAESIGMNTVRVFLQDQLWKQDPEGFKQRLDTFLGIAAKHHIRPLLVLFDSCWETNPHLGPQHPPIPGVHNSGWVQSPGKERLLDRSVEPELKAYVVGVVGAFANDPRILGWDIWNEPDNKGGDKAQDEAAKVKRVNELLPRAFAWARSAHPAQPLTSGVWQGDWSNPAKESETTKIQLAESDVISFHNYGWPEEFEARIQELQPLHRPIVCTEYMARGAGSTFDGSLPVAKKYNVGAINWGLVAGETQTYLPWDSWDRPYTVSQPTVWFHEVFRHDGTPYRPREVELIRQLTGRGEFSRSETWSSRSMKWSDWTKFGLVAAGLMVVAPNTSAQVAKPAQVSGAAGRKDAADETPGYFVDEAVKLGVNFKGIAQHTPTKYLLETMGSGVAVLDYDNDGLLDIFAVNGAAVIDPAPKGFVPAKSGPAEWNRLYHQHKDGSFEDVTEKSGLKGTGYGMGVAAGDYDNDGLEDLYVTEFGGNHLYHNNGDGTFTDVTAVSGTGGDRSPGQGWYTSAAWVDLDNDGLLDLIVLRYVKWDWDDVYCGERREGYRSFCHPDIFPAIPPLVFHNDGKGKFTEAGAKFKINLPGKGLGIALADFNRHGRMDVAIANDSMPQFLYENKGGGLFEEDGMLAQIAVDGDGRTYAGMGIDAQDYNNDGLPDLVITNLANQKYALYTNNGDGSFTYDTYVGGLARMTLLHSGWGIHFFDYDNDGRKDLMVAQGHDLDTVELNYPQLHYKEPMLLAHATADGFVDVSAKSGPAFMEPWVGRGMAIGDLDNDGRLDAVVSTNGGALHILHNETPGKNHWLTLNLVGHTSNRDGIGAEIEVVTAAGKQFEVVSTAGSYLSSSDKRAHFGLGQADHVTKIRIHWPSGIVQVLTEIRADQVLKVYEPGVSTPEVMGVAQ